MWDAATRTQVGTFNGFANYPHAGSVSPDGRFVVLGGAGWSNIGVFDLATGNVAATVRAFGGTDWFVKTPDGLFDGSPNAYRQLGWTFRSTENVPPIPVESFFADYFNPGLLRSVIEGRQMRAPRDLAKLDRRAQPLELSLNDRTVSPAGIDQRVVTLRIRGTGADRKSTRLNSSH